MAVAQASQVYEVLAVYTSTSDPANLTWVSIPSGTNCTDWPTLASYRLTDKAFTCRGTITAFRLCNVQDPYDDTSTLELTTRIIGLILWRKRTIEQDRRTQYGLESFQRFPDGGIGFDIGDQLQYFILDSSEPTHSNEPRYIKHIFAAIQGPHSGIL